MGLAFGPRSGVVGELGTALIQLIKFLALPLLFLAILDTFLTTKVRGRDLARMLGLAVSNAVFALTIGLTISNLLKPGSHIHAIASNQSQSRLNQHLATNTTLILIVVAIVLGLVFRRTQTTVARRTVSRLLRANEILLKWIIRLIPIAVFAVIAKTVGSQGLMPLTGLGFYVGVAFAGLGLHVLVVYQARLLLQTKMKLENFWRGARDAIVYALGASSSIATLPVTLRCLNQMGVSEQSARLASCVGTNLNHDGILLYEAMAVLCVAQIYGVHLTLTQQVFAALTCAVAGMGIAGVPDAGLISLSLVLGAVGLPIEILPFLLTVDWILSRARAVTNVINDMVVAVILDAD